MTQEQVQPYADWPNLPFTLPEGTRVPGGGWPFITWGSQWTYIRGVEPDALFHIDWPDSMNRDGPALTEVTNFPAVMPVNGTVNVGNFPSSQNVVVTNIPHVLVDNFPSSFNVGNFPTSFQVSNFPATQVVSWASPQQVSITNFPATQPVSGTVSVGNFPSNQTVSGTVNVGNWPATQPVSIAGTVNVNATISGNSTPENVFKSQNLNAANTSATDIWTPASGKRVRLYGMRVSGGGTLLALANVAIDLLGSVLGTITYARHYLTIGTTLTNGGLTQPPTLSFGPKGMLFGINEVVRVQKGTALLTGSVDVGVYGVEE